MGNYTATKNIMDSVTLVQKVSFNHHKRSASIW